MKAEGEIVGLKNKYCLAGGEVLPVRWRLKKPFVTSLGSKSWSDNVVVKLRLAGGAVGYGEASSSLAMAFQTQAAMAGSLRRLLRAFRGSDARDTAKIIRAAWRLEKGLPTAVAALEAALWDAFARAEGVPFSRLWGGARTDLETLVTLSAVSPEEVGADARSAARKGFRILKLKINGREPLELNRARVRLARRGAPRARLLLDANQSGTPDALAGLLESLGRDGIAVEALEEPFRKRDWRALAAFRGRAGAPVLLDESIQRPQDAALARSRGLADGVNVKLAKSGLLRGLEIVREFRGASGESRRELLKKRTKFKMGSSASAPRLMIGCMAESKLGLSAAVHWACGLGVFDYADLDSDLLLEPTDCRGGYARRGPVVSLPRRLPPGLGVEWSA